jgi:YD repeat-containing protein
MAKVEGATYSQISSQNNKNPRYSSIALYNKLKSIVPSTTVINTYSYKPLVGMISQTDPNGRTTYYKYDNFGRLKEVKDSDGNVLKSYNYNYAEE